MSLRWHHRDTTMTSWKWRLVPLTVGGAKLLLCRCEGRLVPLIELSTPCSSTKLSTGSGLTPLQVAVGGGGGGGCVCPGAVPCRGGGCPGEFPPWSHLGTPLPGNTYFIVLSAQIWENMNTLWLQCLYWEAGLLCVEGLLLPAGLTKQGSCGGGELCLFFNTGNYTQKCSNMFLSLTCLVCLFALCDSDPADGLGSCLIWEQLCLQLMLEVGALQLFEVEVTCWVLCLLH